MLRFNRCCGHNHIHSSAASITLFGFLFFFFFFLYHFFFVFRGGADGARFELKETKKSAVPRVILRFDLAPPLRRGRRYSILEIVRIGARTTAPISAVWPLIDFSEIRARRPSKQIERETESER